MGRIGKDETPPHYTTNDSPPTEEDDCESPPADYQPQSAAPTTNNRPPPQDDHAHPFPPNISTDHQFNQQHQNVSMQPQPQPTFYQPPPVVVYIPPPTPQPNYQQPSWNTDLFDCMSNPQNAVITLFCPCVTFGQIAEILDSGSSSCFCRGMCYSCIALHIGMPCIMSCAYRSKLRSKFGLPESPAPDCLVHFFCEFCALCQEYRELEQRGFDPSIGWSGNASKQQQIVQQQMVQQQIVQQQIVHQQIVIPPMQQIMK